jgi:hypothetical protein
MFRLFTNAVVLLLSLMLLTFFGCATNRSAQSNSNSAPAANKQTAAPAQSAETSKTQTAPGSLRVGEASGSYNAKGETVNLKYAYAGRAQRFGEDAVVILLTDQEIPAGALADEIKNQTMLLDEKIHGLEYVIMKDGYWVRYHPGQYQESKSPSLKDYTIENDIVKGSDEDKGDLTDGKYARSVKFVAAISK